MIESNCYPGVCPNARIWERELKNKVPADADDARPVLDWVELLCVQTPEDERVSSKTEFQLMLMMLALRFAELVELLPWGVSKRAYMGA